MALHFSHVLYVRPGAAPIDGAVTTTGPGGALGQVRPLINMGPIVGRGRGDWRPPGIKGGPIGRGFGMPAWGNNSLGRGFGGGLEFTLPSHKTIFEVDIDSFEEKPWKYPGVDPTGRAIQVEGGYGERLPSIDTRPARTRDTEAIIEITLQGSLEDDSSTGNGVLERSENNSPKVDPKGGHLVEEGGMALDTEHSDDLPHTSIGRKKREMVGRRAPFRNSVNDDMPEGDGILPLPSDASIQLQSGRK